VGANDRPVRTPAGTGTAGAPSGAQPTAAPPAPRRTWSIQPATPAAAPAASGRRWARGEECEARWSEDGQWYRAVVEDYTPVERRYCVRFVDYGNEDLVPASDLRPLAAPAAPSTVPAAPSPAPAGAWQVGDLCEARWTEDDEWYAARIESIHPSGQQVAVYFTEYGNRDVVTLDRLRRPSAPAHVSTGASPKSPAWTVGQLCEARWTEDDVWYQARIDAVSADGRQYAVTFVEYGNTDTVGPERLRPSAAAAVAPPVAAPPAAPAAAAAAPARRRWAVGDLCEARWSEDDVWYRARIDAVSAAGDQYSVTFVEYGNTDVVGPARLRPAPAPAAARPAPAASPVLPQWRAGDACEARWTEDNEWYAAVIDGVSPDGKHFKVTFTEYGNVDIVTADRLRPLPGKTATVTPAAAAVAAAAPVRVPAPAVGQVWGIGDECEACWTEDNIWYTARIVALSPHGDRVTVVFPEYGNQDTVTLDRVRPAPRAAGAPKWKRGDVCEARWTVDNVWYKAVVDSVAPDGRHFSVTFPEYGNSDVVTADQLRVPPVVRPTWTVGDVCEAQWTEDNVWYTARIDAISPDQRLYTVTFPEYGNSDVVTADRLRRKPATAVPTATVTLPSGSAAPAPDRPQWKVGA